jgi:hypothetical protein
MKITITFVHAVVDHGIGVLLLIGPWLFGFAEELRATLFTQAFGLALIGYSLCTDYELALRRKIPLWAHLGLDLLCGGLLIAAPWLFGFAAVTWIPHLVIGTVTASRPALFVASRRISRRVEVWNARDETHRRRATRISS